MTRTFFILDDEVGKFADCAGAKAKQCRRIIVGKALKIPVYPPFFCGDGQRISGQCEMIEADGDISGLGQPIEAQPSLFEAEFVIGQIAGVDPALARAGTPLTPDDLIRHDCFMYSFSATGNHWELEDSNGEP